MPKLLEIVVFFFVPPRFDPVRIDFAHLPEKLTGPCYLPDYVYVLVLVSTCVCDYVRSKALTNTPNLRRMGNSCHSANLAVPSDI